MKRGKSGGIILPMHDGREAGFPAAMRLKKRSDFARIYGSGTARRGDLLSLYVLAGAAAPRMGIVLPRHFGTAVERNRMKRLLREAFRRNRSLFEGREMIVRPHAGCKGRTAVEVERALTDEFRRAVGTEVRE